MQIGKDIQQATQLLLQGKLVAIPTETVYGLAANALDESAIKKIFEAKNRPLHNPLILHVPYKSELKKYVLEVPAILEELMDNFSPGPITYLLPKNELVSNTITNNSDLVAVRIPNHTMLLKLLNTCKFPLVAPSANKFGSISPTKVEHVEQQFSTEVDYILDGGSCQTGLESTIVGLDNDEIVIYRHGAITQEMLQKVYPKIKTKTNNNINPEAPGMLLQHYSPNTKLILHNSFEDMITVSLFSDDIGFISFTNTIPEAKNVLILSEKKSLDEAGKNLYNALYEMDKKNLKEIHIHLLENKGLGIAINDKLVRASAKFL